MGKYDAVILSGAERDAALAKLHAQLAEWGLTMPPVEAMALHFGLNDFYTIGETEFWVANEAELGYCGKFLFVFDGQTCPFHRHKMKHETFFIVKGAITMKLDDREQVMKDGDLLAMPPGVGHSFTGIGPCLILEVSMPSILQDNFFADTRIGDNGVI
jgi:mannose-6-phosphate isomerase-like protein (cupin superfamily)